MCIYNCTCTNNSNIHINIKSEWDIIATKGADIKYHQIMINISTINNTINIIWGCILSEADTSADIVPRSGTGARSATIAPKGPCPEGTITWIYIGKAGATIIDGLGQENDSIYK